MQNNIQDGYVKVDRKHGITHVEFHHPQSNSLPGALLENLALTIHRLSHDGDTKVIILKSAGEKVFCSGASFDELASIKSEAEGLKFFSGFANVINEMRKAPQFIIARIQGKCVGGGVGLAAAADYAIATEGAEVKLSELAVGIGPFVVGPAVERKIGLAAFSHLTIDAATFRSAEWAKRKGLFAELHHDITTMDDAIDRLATTLSHYHPAAMAELKAIFWKGTEHWDKLLKERAAISGKLILSDHSKNFIEKFKAKQKK
jgi:methylglutaconyl-CoA hydratase